MKAESPEIDSLKRDILTSSLDIQNIIQKIQHPDVTESVVWELNSQYRAEYRHLKQLVDDLERLVKEEDDDSGLMDQVNLHKSQLMNLQSSFRRAKSKEDLIDMSTNVTSNLRNVSQTMASVVEQSKNTLEVLAISSQAVTDNQDEFHVMGSAIGTAKKLVSRYGRRETTDMILIVLALIAFFAACVYVIQKRMF
nr:EOG090X0EO1 [Ilyocryptus agilis]